jgi:hypothetical protein
LIILAKLLLPKFNTNLSLYTLNGCNEYPALANVDGGAGNGGNPGKDGSAVRIVLKYVCPTYIGVPFESFLQNSFVSILSYILFICCTVTVDANVFIYSLISNSNLCIVSGVISISADLNHNAVIAAFDANASKYCCDGATVNPVAIVPPMVIVFYLPRHLCTN